jgi:hypothetical protein
MKSDGTDQMNTVAKTAEYPFERLALGRDTTSLWAGDILWFISSLVRACSMVVACALLSASDSRAARKRRFAETADTKAAAPIRAPKLWDTALH